MRDDKPTPVRLDPELLLRLKSAAERTGIKSRGAIIKLCLEAFLDDYEERGEAALPMDWREILQARDGRRRHAPMIAAEANGHGATVIINHGAGKAARYKISKRKGLK